MIGIAVSTYADNDTSKERIKIIEECLASLVPFSNDHHIIVINDGSDNEEHRKLLKKFKQFEIVELQKNRGVAYSKNTAMKYFYDLGYEHFFLLDDDIEIISSDCFSTYSYAMEKTGIDHYCHMLRDDPKYYAEYTIHKDIPIQRGWHINGVFIALHRNCITRHGYMYVFEKKFGGEHDEYTKRCMVNDQMEYILDIQENGLIKYNGWVDTSGDWESKDMKNSVAECDAIGWQHYVPFVGKEILNGKN